ncbi:hypothetical protein GYH30_040325 [Glycine max]|nr:hypothetical protein GYH30_040325 [Glycine max]
MAMSVARLRKDEIQRLEKEIDSLRHPTVELHESETSAALKNLLEERERMPALLVFSSGTAFNGIVEELKNFTTRVAHVLPVSDDEGSTGEIVSVLVFLHLGIFVEPNFGGKELGILIDWVRVCIAGGPAVRDICSKCLRLFDQSTIEAFTVRNLAGHRLPLDPLQAKSEWLKLNGYM